MLPDWSTLLNVGFVGEEAPRTLQKSGIGDLGGISSQSANNSCKLRLNRLLKQHSTCCWVFGESWTVELHIP